jgi:hypothetical protein
LHFCTTEPVVGGRSDAVGTSLQDMANEEPGDRRWQGMIGNLTYIARLLCGLGWSMPRALRYAALPLLTVGALLGAAAVSGSVPASGVGGGDVDALSDRAERMSMLLEQVEDVYGEHVAPLERALLVYRNDDPQLVRRIAVSLVREARRTELEPRLLLAVLLVENPWLDPEARSSAGATGLMQVMPFHRGRWAPCPPRLDDVDANICHGASIFAAYLKQSNGNIDRALLRYNGCVTGSTTPNCHQYPTHVYARAGRASVLAWRNHAMAASP